MGSFFFLFLFQSLFSINGNSSLYFFSFIFRCTVEGLQMEDSSDARVRIKYSSSGFCQVTSHETLGISEGLGVRGFFPSGYLPATNGRQVKNSLKYCMKKKIYQYFFYYDNSILLKARHDELIHELITMHNHEFIQRLTAIISTV